MDFGPICHVLYSITLRRLNRENVYFSHQGFKIWWLIRGIKVMKNTNISAKNFFFGLGYIVSEILSEHFVLLYHAFYARTGIG